MNFSEEAFKVSYGFKNSSKVFWEHLNGVKTKTFLVQLIANFFHCPKEKVFLDLVLVEEDVSKETFLSMAEKQQQKDQVERERKRRGLTNHPLIKKAEKIFNSRVDKVILN